MYLTRCTQYFVQLFYVFPLITQILGYVTFHQLFPHNSWPGFSGKYYQYYKYKVIFIWPNNSCGTKALSGILLGNYPNLPGILFGRSVAKSPGNRIGDVQCTSQINKQSNINKSRVHKIIIHVVARYSSLLKGSAITSS